MRGGPVHLVRRALTSLRNTPLTGAECAVAADVLGAAEMELWMRMQPRDQRHSLAVLRRFDVLRPGSPRHDRAAALLHDVGKSAVHLGWTGRVIATVVGPRTGTFARYLDHERIGAEMLISTSEPETVRLVSGGGNSEAAQALRSADDI